MRTVYGDHERFKKTYFSTYKGYYFTGDGCKRDDDGYFWITGRVDDVINVSGHRIGTAEVEGALGKHPKVAEAAVVGFPHEIKGQGIYAYVTLKSGEVIDESLTKELVQKVRIEIGAIASPDKIQFADGLPKTRSGKIMRRILRKIAYGKAEWEIVRKKLFKNMLECIQHILVGLVLLRQIKCRKCLVYIGLMSLVCLKRCGFFQ